MNKFVPRNFRIITILISSLILLCIFAPNPEMLRQHSSYELSEAAVMQFYPEDGEQAFLKPIEIYREMPGRYQTFKYIIVIALAVMLLINGHNASVFACSLLFYLIKRFNTSVIAFSLGGRGPPLYLR